MSFQPKFLAFAGALRNDSTNKKIVTIAVEGAWKAGAQITHIELNDFSVLLYNGDDEAAYGFPAPAVGLQELMFAHDGFLISSPEYDRSLSDMLKTYINWTSCPRGEHKDRACYSGKAVIVLNQDGSAKEEFVQNKLEGLGKILSEFLTKLYS